MYVTGPSEVTAPGTCATDTTEPTKCILRKEWPVIPGGLALTRAKGPKAPARDRRELCVHSALADLRRIHNVQKADGEGQNLREHSACHDGAVPAAASRT